VGWTRDDPRFGASHSEKFGRMLPLVAGEAKGFERGETIIAAEAALADVMDLQAVRRSAPDAGVFVPFQDFAPSFLVLVAAANLTAIWKDSNPTSFSFAGFWGSDNK